MSRQTWGVTIFGLALKPNTIKEKYREDVMECNLLELKYDLREDRIELPPFLGFAHDKERVIIGYFPVYPWALNGYNKSAIPQTEQEAMEMIKKVLAKIVIDVSSYSDDDFEYIDSYNCG